MSGGKWFLLSVLIASGEIRAWSGGETRSPPVAADAASDVARFDARIAADTTLASADGLVWSDAAALPMESKVCAETATRYGRIPSDLIDKVPRGIREMSAHSTGHYFLFRTDSDKLGVRWRCRQVSWSDPYIPPQGMYGVDIYAKTGGQWRFVKNGRLGKDAWQETRVDLPGSGLREVMVYLPIRAEVLDVRLGVAGGKALAPCGHASGHVKPVVHYGTSLVHGGCASRPGLMFTSVAARQADVPYVNLGFSGQARLDLVMADVMARADAALYIVDPVWNCDEKLVEERTEPFVRRLHELRPDVPILLCEGPEAAGVRIRANEALKRACEKLKADPALAGKIHYLPCTGMLPDDGEATHDYIHPNDYGCVQMGRVFAKAIAAILRCGDIVAHPAHRVR